ncbi:uncharacterized protein LOC143032223 [Oratosquilla oratoria]|uniref:uncharacterized protein LOC143032223 n=1 Tax=Oratosquilla oratoria TaxID=337810 RepID=UPI003F7588F3
MLARRVSQTAQHEKRPKGSPSDMLTDLHVYIVPQDRWIPFRRLARNQVVDETVSAGFVRVTANITLFDLRREMKVQLGDDAPLNYVFIRSVGRNFTQVKTHQEHQLKAKHFLPPFASDPEVHILELSESLLLKNPSLSNLVLSDAELSDSQAPASLVGLPPTFHTTIEEGDADSDTDIRGTNSAKGGNVTAAAGKEGLRKKIGSTRRGGEGKDRGSTRGTGRETRRGGQFSDEDDDVRERGGRRRERTKVGQGERGEQGHGADADDEEAFVPSRRSGIREKTRGLRGSRGRRSLSDSRVGSESERERGSRLGTKSHRQRGDGPSRGTSGDPLRRSQSEDRSSRALRQDRAHWGKIPSPQSLNDLKPIAITPIPSLICEDFVFNWACSNTRNKIDLQQFGNIKTSSITHCLIDLLDFIHRNFDKRNTSLALTFIDFRK